MNLFEELLEMYMPRKNLGRLPYAVDYITRRKLERQENIENMFVLIFFQIIESFTPKNEYSVEKFIDRFHTYITGDKSRGDISIAEIMWFIRALDNRLIKRKTGKKKAKAKMSDLQNLKAVANVTGIRSIARLSELKTALDQDLLARVKRVMRGTSKDTTHAGVSHPIQVLERYTAMRIKSIRSRWHMRKVQRQIRDLDTVGS